MNKITYIYKSVLIKTNHLKLLHMHFQTIWDVGMDATQNIFV